MGKVINIEAKITGIIPEAFTLIGKYDKSLILFERPTPVCWIGTLLSAWYTKEMISDNKINNNVNPIK